MKFIPILYSTPMVQAVDQDRKNQTRRTKDLDKVNENPDKWKFRNFVKRSDGVLFFQFDAKEGEGYELVKCPYGKPGDVLWVRESFHKYESETKGIIYSYKANHNLISGARIWKPSIHMPKQAARLFLRIKDIRVERLNDINRGDCMAEGCPFPNIAQETDPKTWFIELWESINGKDSVELNPWVWVIEFEKIEKPENFLE